MLASVECFRGYVPAIIHSYQSQLALPVQENRVNPFSSPNDRPEAVSGYVAEMHLHMALHARKLVPTIGQARDGRERMLQETQALVEKLASRQMSLNNRYPQ